MADHMLRRSLWVFIAAGALLGLTMPARACPFCTMQGETLTDAVSQASMVLLGTHKNAKLDPGGEGGTTELHLASVIKSHPIIADQKVVILPRYVPVTKNTTSFLVFCDVYKGKIDPYRGMPVESVADTGAYFKGLLALKDKDVASRLLFFFNHLESADLEISTDAYKEFGNASYKDVQAMLKQVPANTIADKVTQWLQDSKTPSFRYGLYASLLGYAGNEKHAAILRKMLDDPDKRLTSGVDGMLAGYTMLQPKEGWAYIRSLMQDSKKEFLLRYNALKAVRFFWEYRPDLIEKKELVNGLNLLLDQGDIADLAIEDLRKWGRTEMADRVIGLFGLPSHNLPIIRRSIMRFALSFPDQPKLAAFVEQQRKKDADWVKDVEEVLKIDTAPPPAATN
jgi:hypothetical protein